MKDCSASLGFGIETTNPGKAVYNEGIHVGYRYYESFDVPVAFPFGFGLSYTTFAFSNLKISSINSVGEFEVTVDVENTGTMAGKEVIQVYVKDLISTSVRPSLELKGFTKVSLEPGQKKTATVKLDRDALKFYDEKRDRWVAEKGEFEILVGSNLRSLSEKATVTLRDSLFWTG